MNIPSLLISCALGLLWPWSATALYPNLCLSPGLSPAVRPAVRPGSPPASAVHGRTALEAGGTEDETALEGGKTRSKALVIVLHGGSWRPRPVAQLARSALDALSSEARRRKLRLLAPMAPLECRSTVPWLEPAGEAVVLELIDRELLAGRADADRIYLAGHGSGATAALILASRHPQRFAAVAAWSGTPPPLWDESEDVVGLAPDPIPGLKDVPVYLWSGDDDPVLDRGALRFFVEAMKAAAKLDSGHELRWEKGPGGHDYGEEGPRAGLKFLRARRKQPRPAGAASSGT